MHSMEDLGDQVIQYETELDPLVGGHLTFERVRNHYPQKVTKTCREMLIFVCLFKVICFAVAAIVNHH